MTVLFVVTSLMGAGHLARTLILARAVNAAGGRAVVVSGGRPLAHLDHRGVDMRPLPPVWSDGVDYSVLLTPDGPADQAYLAARADRLVALYEAIAPDVVTTELWPFGRRSLSREYEALARAAKGRARIFASVRDVLEPKKKPERADETAARLRAWYDGVLVHGDPKVIGLGATWPRAHEFTDIVRHTGYVAEPPPPPDEDAGGEVLVSVGGGVIGRSLLAAAAAAAGRGSRLWRLRVGGADAAAESLRLIALAGDAPVVAEPAGPDYRARLSGAACSISLLGYNTATDILGAGTPALIAPMAEGGEAEQRIRADAFARLPGITRLTSLDPDALHQAAEAAIARAGPPPGLVDLGGAAATARLLLS